MQRRYSEMSSFQKLSVQADIQKEITKAFEYHKTNLIEFINEYSEIKSIVLHRKELYQDSLSLEYIDEFNQKWDSYKNIEDKLTKVTNYLKRVLTCADSIDTAKSVIPEYYRKYVTYAAFNGYLSYEALYDESCFLILEEAILTNVLLQIE